VPNTRMQRTRSSPSALRSPLMRCPLGRRNNVVAVILGALLVSFVAGVGCSSCPPAQNLVVFNQTGQPERIDIRLDGQQIYLGLLGTVEGAPAIVINQIFRLPEGSHEICVAVPGRQFEKCEPFQVKAELVNLVVMVNRENIQLNVSYGSIAYL